MLNAEGYEIFIRTKMNLEGALSDTGSMPVSREVELQMRFTEERLTAKLKQAYSHATQEMAALERILGQSLVDDE